MQVGSPPEDIQNPRIKKIMPLCQANGCRKQMSVVPLGYKPRGEWVEGTPG
jgi:hypothetical protein